MREVNERITTVDDGATTVNERLSSGGPGPDGQRETVTERLSGVEPTAEPIFDEAPTAESPTPKAKRPTRRAKD